MQKPGDRNFDDLAERFAEKVYGGLKGQIRLEVLWRDILAAIGYIEGPAPLKILDVGGGLGQLSLRLAERGHNVVFNDLSSVMVEKTRHTVVEAGLEERFEWHTGPYQDLTGLYGKEFDVVLCHALLEWLEHPEEAVATLAPMVATGGYLSLAFYNPAAMLFRNLIRGNFNWVREHENWQPDSGSLTPENPCTIEQVREWLSVAGLGIQSESGLRVFNDYVVEKRGGNAIPEEVLAMELEFSNREPFKWLGRYFHFLAVSNQ